MVATDTNGVLVAPLTFLSTNMSAGSNVTFLRTNGNLYISVPSAGAGGSGDAGGTNARQFGSLNLTNWSGMATGAITTKLTSNAFLGNWSTVDTNWNWNLLPTNLLSSKVDGQANSNLSYAIGTASTNRENLFSVAASNLSYSIGTDSTNRENLFSVANSNLSYSIGTASTNRENLFSVAASNLSYSIGTDSTNRENLFSVANTNLSYSIGTDSTNRENLFSVAASNLSYTIGANGSNFSGTIPNQTNTSLTASTVISADANKKITSIANGTGMLTNNGAGVVGYMAIPNGTVLTNANQFGATANGEIVIKTGALVTNLTVHGTAGAATTLSINANSSGGGALIKARDTAAADVFVVQVDGTIQGNGPGGGPLLIGPTTAGFVLTANASGYGSWAAVPASTTTNANQFGATANGQLSIKDGSVQTNNVFYGTNVTIRANNGEFMGLNVVGNTNDYFQINARNASAGANAESGFSATADNGTETTAYAWLGINSSAFSAVRNYSLGGANDVALIGSGNDFEIGNANTNKDIIFNSAIAATPFWNQRAIIRSTTQRGTMGVTAGFSSSNAWVGGKLIEVNLQSFTNINSILTLTNAYTNATLIAAHMLTNNGDMIKLEWTIAHKRLQPATNLFQIVYGSQIIYDSGNCAASNGMSTILANVIRTGASAQVCQITSFFAMGGTTVFATTNTWHQTAAQSNWLATPIGLRMASSGFMLVTNVGFRAYYEPSTQ